MVLVGVAGGAIAFAATRGPSVAEKRAHAAAVAQALATAHAAAVHTVEVQLLGDLKITPADGATAVPLNSPVTVAATSGTLSSVTVVSASGAALSGALSSVSGEWMSSGPLLASTTYTVTVEVALNGVTATSHSTFVTLTPVATVTASVFPTNGLTVGVGQPLVLRFDHAISDPTVQKAIESRVTVAMSTPVPGAWYWFSEYELHFRPQSFWPTHETVRVSADFDGIDVGNGEWAAGSVLDTFTIGDARISYANLQTEVMTVTLNGATEYTFPISGGRPQYPTMNGVHIVLDRESVVHMVSSTVGIPVNSPNGYDEYVYDDVHISDSGEYVHAAPWSVADQGFTNVSHGCINLSTAHALDFFDFSRVGDVVEVTGSPRPAAYGDHGVMDWSGPAWSEWTPAQVVALASASGTAPTTTSTTTATTVAPARSVTETAPTSATTTRPTTTVAATTTTKPKATTTTTKPKAITTTTKLSTTTTR